MPTIHQKNFALITGASSGIGEAYARKLAGEGYSVILVARRANRLQKLASELTAAHSVPAHVLAVDLAAPGGVTKLLAEIENQKWNVEILINNAGFGTNGVFLDVEVGRELEMIDLNCKSLVELSYGIGRKMRVQGKGTIVHTASVGGLSPVPYFAVYGATKAFVVSFSEALAEELKGTGVQVQTLCPGPTETEFGAVSNYRGQVPPRFVTETAAGVVARSYRQIQRGAPSFTISGRAFRLVTFLSRFMPRSALRTVAARAGLPQAVHSS